MSRDKTLDTADWVAWFAVGVPLLCGSIILVLIFVSPDSAPARDRGRMLPIGVGVVTAAIVGAGFYTRWRLRKLRALELHELAESGVFPAAAVRRSEVLTRISDAVADEFVLPVGSCALPIHAPKVTAGLIADAVWDCVERLRERNELRVDPSSVDAACKAIAPFATKQRGAALEGASRSSALCPAVSMHTALDDLVPLRRRHALVRALREQGALPPPPLTTPKWALGIAVFLSLVVTFGATVPAAMWMDRTHPIENPGFVITAVAAILVRGGFFVLLLVSVVVFALIARWLIPTFPKSLRLVSHVAAFLAPPELRKQTAPWTKELAWRGLRTIVARVLGRVEQNVGPTTVCE